MGKLINSDIVLSYIDRLSSCGLGKKKSLEYLKKYVSAQPEAVIRCKDCKYRERNEVCYLWSEYGNCTGDDDFCSYVERRTDGTDRQGTGD